MLEHVATPTRSRAAGFADVLRSEFTKLASVRSTYLTLIAAFGVTITASVGLCEAYVRRASQLRLTQLKFNPTSYSLTGILVAQLAIGVLGVLVITSEHASGMIRSTFAAVPQRGTVLAAKALVFGAVTLLVGEVASFSAFGIGQFILTARHAQESLTDPGVLRAVVGAGLYLTVLGLLALAIGVIIRHSAGAIATLFGILLVLPAMTEGLPDSLQNQINPYLPGNAGQAIFRTAGDAHLLAPWSGFALFCLYATVAMTAAVITIRTRDA